MSVLELGAAENSYLPEGLKLNRHVGVGAVKSQMESNPSITESFVADFKAHPFIKKVFALSQGTRADYLGEECIVRRGRAFTTSCLRNF